MIHELIGRLLESGRYVERPHKEVADASQRFHLQHCGKFRDEADLAVRQRLPRHSLSCPVHLQAQTAVSGSLAMLVVQSQGRLSLAVYCPLPRVRDGEIDGQTEMGSLA